MTERHDLGERRDRQRRGDPSVRPVVGRDGQHDAPDRLRCGDELRVGRGVGGVGFGEQDVHADGARACLPERVEQLRVDGPGPRPAAQPFEALGVDRDDHDVVGRRPFPRLQHRVVDDGIPAFEHVADRQQQRGQHRHEREPQRVGARQPVPVREPPHNSGKSRNGPTHHGTREAIRTEAGFEYGPARPSSSSPRTRTK